MEHLRVLAINRAIQTALARGHFSSDSAFSVIFSTSVMLIKVANAVWFAAMKSSPVLTTVLSDLKVALELDVRNVVILVDG